MGEIDGAIRRDGAKVPESVVLEVGERWTGGEVAGTLLRVVVGGILD